MPKLNECDLNPFEVTIPMDYSEDALVVDDWIVHPIVPSEALDELLRKVETGVISGSELKTVTSGKGCKDCTYSFPRNKPKSKD